MGRNLEHASSVGMIRNMSTGYVSPQYHVIYDNKFETVMGGLENNEAVTYYIWENLGTQNNSEHIIYTATPHIPTLDQTWMIPDDQDVERSQYIDAEVTRRINTPSIEATHLGSPDPVHNV